MSPNSLHLVTETIQELLRRHQSEEVVQSLEEKIDQQEKFFALVSHDLRAPLSVAKAGAELISQVAATRPELCASISSKIVSAMDRAEAMIKDFLDANRIQAGIPLRTEFADCDLSAIIRLAIADHTLVHSRDFRFEGPESVTGRWDAGGLRRSLDNLLSNAVKYGQSDKPITVSLTENGERVTLSVHNQGASIPPAELKRLFQWYQRAKQAEDSSVGGWGLGLMLVKAIVEAHGGTITVTSASGAGTTFSVELPRLSP